MTSTTTWIASLVVGVALALGTGCAHTPAPVPLTGAWPALPSGAAAEADSADDAYHEQTEIWSRQGTVRTSYREVLSIDVTLAAPPWRVAKLAREAALQALPAPALEAALAAARADDAEAYKVYVQLTTWDRRENNLDRGERAVWRPVLIADDGQQLAPSKITRDKRPRPVLLAEFPGLGDFAEIYLVTFPRTLELFGSTAKQIRLRMVGAEGAVEVSWRAP